MIVDARRTAISLVAVSRRTRARTGRIAPVALLLLASAFPAAYLAWTVVTHWVNVPHMDQWDISHVFIQHHDGQLSFKNLIAQHNESRKLFPRLIFLGMGLLSGWDVRWEMVLTMVVAGLTSLNLFLLLRRLPCGRWWHFGTYVLLNVVLFSPVQWSNWLWGIQLVVFIPPLMLTTGLLVASSSLPLWGRSVLGSALAFVATFSYANGMILWILLLPLEFLGLHHGRVTSGRSHRWFARLWYGLSAAATIFLYFHDYHQPPGKPPMSLVFSQPVEALRYLLAWAGSPLVPESSTFSQDTRMVVGGAAISLYLAGVGRAVARRSMAPLGAAYPWIVLGLYGLVSGVTTTLGRMGFGLEQAADSRYTTFSIYLLIAIIGLTPATVGYASPRQRILRVLTFAWLVGFVGALAFFHGNALVVSQRAVTGFSTRLQEGRLGLSLHKVFHDEGRLVLLYPNVEFLKVRAVELAAMGLLDTPLPAPGRFWEGRGPHDEGEAAWGTLDVCRVAESGDLLFSGWARDPRRGQPGTNVVLVYTDWRGHSAPFAIRRVMQPRPDVAAFLGDTGATRCGFASHVGAAALPLGKLEVSAWTIDEDSAEAHQLSCPKVVLHLGVW